MDIGDFFERHGAVVAGNWGLFLTWTGIVASVVWAVAHFTFGHRIDALKERVDYWKEKAEEGNGLPTVPSPEASIERHSYPDLGAFGPNVLAEGIHDVEASRSYSLSALVPSGNKLRVLIKGPPPANLGDNGGAWVFNLNLRNWVGGPYNEDTHSQWFEAVPGVADLEITFLRSGSVSLVVYESGRDPTWEKALHVKAGPKTAPAGPVYLPSSTVAKPAFSPSELDTQVIKLLRFMDGSWISYQDLVAAMKPPSRQDLWASLQALTSIGWAEGHPENYLRAEPHEAFRLGHGALGFAREQGFITQTEAIGREPTENR
jgi:hypothetical protein